MWPRMRTLLVRLVETRGTAAFLAASLAVGVLVGIGASLLVWGIAGIEWLSDRIRVDSGLGVWAAAVTIPAGLLTSWAINRLWGPGIDGGGVTETMVGVSVHGGYLPTRIIGPKIAATAVTLGSGGSAGREGPVVLIGAAIGSSFARYTRFGEDQIRSLVAAGAAAGIGASFNAPIAGMLFAMEVILGNFAIRHLNAVVISSVAAAVTARELVGAERLLTAPPHRLGHPAELILYTVLGVLAFLLASLFIRVSEAAAPLRTRYPGWVRPVVAGLGVAVLVGIRPELFGTGQTYLAGVLRLESVSDELWLTFLVIAVLKILAATLTRAGGGSGGTMMPSLVIGGSLGAALALLVGPVWGVSTLNPGAFAVVGMAATFAATGSAPLTAILIVFEITGNYDLVLPLMLAAALATLLTDRVHHGSLYTMPLRRAGIHLVTTEDIDLLDTVTVGDVMTVPSTVLTADMAATEAAEVLQAGRHHGLPVVDEGRLVGVLTVSDLAVEDGPGDARLVADAMTPRPITVAPGMPVSAALARMAALGVGRLPVVADDSPDRLVGMFRRESVVRAYHQALAAAADRSLYRARLRQRTLKGAGFFELPVPPESPAGGRRVRELPWPEGATLVSVRRGASVLIPHGDTELRTGDTITAFGTGDARVELAHMIEPGRGRTDAAR